MLTLRRKHLKRRNGSYDKLPAQQALKNHCISVAWSLELLQGRGRTLLPVAGCIGLPGHLTNFRNRECPFLGWEKYNNIADLKWIKEGVKQAFTILYEQFLHSPNKQVALDLCWHQLCWTPHPCLPCTPCDSRNATRSSTLWLASPSSPPWTSSYPQHTWNRWLGSSSRRWNNNKFITSQARVWKIMQIISIDMHMIHNECTYKCIYIYIYIYIYLYIHKCT